MPKGSSSQLLWRGMWQFSPVSVAGHPRMFLSCRSVGGSRADANGKWSLGQKSEVAVEVQGMARRVIRAPVTFHGAMTEPLGVCPDDKCPGEGTCTVGLPA